MIQLGRFKDAGDIAGKHDNCIGILRCVGVMQPARGRVKRSSRGERNENEQGKNKQQAAFGARHDGTIPFLIAGFASVPGGFAAIVSVSASMKLLRKWLGGEYVEVSESAGVTVV